MGTWVIYERFVKFCVTRVFPSNVPIVQFCSFSSFVSLLFFTHISYSCTYHLSYSSTSSLQNILSFIQRKKNFYSKGINCLYQYRVAPNIHTHAHHAPTPTNTHSHPCTPHLHSNYLFYVSKK